jgi:hypothetical protein
MGVALEQVGAEVVHDHERRNRRVAGAEGKGEATMLIHPGDSRNFLCPLTLACDVEKLSKAGYDPGDYQRCVGERRS